MEVAWIRIDVMQRRLVPNILQVEATEFADVLDLEVSCIKQGANTTHDVRQIQLMMVN